MPFLLRYTHKQYPETISDSMTMGLVYADIEWMISIFCHSFLFSYSFILAKPLYVNQIDVDGNIYLGCDADVFIDIKVCVAVVFV